MDAIAAASKCFVQAYTLHAGFTVTFIGVAVDWLVKNE
jgi:hypothetical protein